MRKFKSLFCVLFSVTLLSSCATIFTGSSKKVSFSSTPDSAKLVITNINGETIFEGYTPAIVKLKAGGGYFKNQNYTVNFTKDGYDPVVKHITSSLNGWYFGNILIGGLIGMVFVDPATGAMYKIDTEAMDATLQKPGTVAYVDVKTLPESVKKQLVPIEANTIK